MYTLLFVLALALFTGFGDNGSDRTYDPTPQAVSADLFVGLIASTMTLSRDIAKYAITHAIECLPSDYKHTFDQSLIRITESSVPMYRSMESRIFPVLDYTSVLIKNLHQELNKQSGKIIDPLVDDFESRYPSGKGKIGSTFVDRLFLICWLLLVTRATIWILCLPRRLYRKCVRNSRRARKQFNPPPLFPSQRLYTPPPVSSPDTPDDKPTQPVPPRTIIKKRLAI